MGAIRPEWGDTNDLPSLPSKKPNSYSKNSPKQGQVRKHLQWITGVYLVAMDGISLSLAQTIISEIGTDMRKFPEAGNFCHEYQIMTANEYERRFREREIKYLLRKATRLGFAISPITASLQAVS